MAAPRFPFEKSYAARILIAFLSRRATRRDHSACVVAHRPNDHKQLTRVPQSDGDEALLGFGIRVFDSDRQRILKYALGVGGRNCVFP